MRKFLFFLLAALVFCASIVSAQRDDIPDNCEYPTEFQHVNWIPRYEYQNQQLVLIDWSTAETVMVLESNLLTEYFSFLEWSPDCHYLAALINPLGDLYIWDSSTGSRMGSLPNSSGGSWGLDWSPDSNYILMISERNLVLWHLPSNSRYVLIENLSSFEQSYFNLAEGYVSFEDNDIEITRRFDLATGHELGGPVGEDAAVVANSNFSFSNYSCVRISEGYYQLRNPATNTQLYLDSDGARLVLRDGVRPQGYEANDPIMQVIEENNPTSVFRFRGWSSDCRYAAASLGAEWQNNTVIWDVQNAQRLGQWDDARNGVHGLSWSSVVADHLIIQTRDGSFFWQILDNNRQLISSSPLDFIRWLPERSAFLAVPQGINGVKAYNISTGQEQSFYHIGERTAPVEYGIQGAWLFVYSSGEHGNRGAALWNLDTGQNFQIVHPVIHPIEGYDYWWRPDPQYWEWSMSPNARYFVAMFYRENLIKVWDMTAIREDGEPNYTHFVSYVGLQNTPSWIDEETLEFGTGLARWNIVSGVQIGESPVLTNDSGSPELVFLPASAGAYGISNNWRDSDEFGTCPYNNNGLFLQPDPNARQLHLRDLHSGEIRFELEDDFVGRIHAISWSPDCRLVAAYIGFWYPEGSTGRNHTAVWNVETGQRLLLSDFSMYTVVWNPDGQSAIFLPERFRPHGILWHIDTGEVYTMDYPGRLSYSTVYWDYGRNQIYVNGWAGAFAFNADTGQYLQTYTRPHDGPSQFTISPDGNFMAVYTSRGYRGLTVWNLNTAENWQLNVEDYTPWQRDEVQFSDDNRYLAIRGTVLRVWDLQAFPEELELRLPILRFEIPESASWQFEGNDVILITADGIETRQEISGLP